MAIVVGTVSTIASTGCQRAPPLRLSPPGELPDLIGIIPRDGGAVQVGGARFDGDSVLVGVVWPDDQRLGWRLGDTLRLRLDEVEAAVSLSGVGAEVWEVLSTEYQETPVTWQEVYVFQPGETVRPTCSRVALLFQRPSRTSEWDGRFEPAPEQARVSAGRLGGNAVYLSWIDGDSSGGLFGPYWDYPTALAVRCPDLTPPPDRSRPFGGLQ